MIKKTIPLAQLTRNQTAKIASIHGGHGFRRRLQVLGIREGQTVKVLSKQPLRGPLTISIGGNCQMTLGRGMAYKIMVEES
jgi:Fe2+ transport system protein FeoA